MNPKKVATARKLYDSRQHTVAEIAQMLDVSVATIYRHLPKASSANDWAEISDHQPAVTAAASAN